MLVYGRDFYEDEAVKLMTLEQEAAYWRLLMHAWREGSIPADVEQLRVIVGKVPARRWPAVWAGIAPKWAPADGTPGRLVNKRQEAERQKRLESKRRQSEGGRAGNAKRWGSEQPDEQGGDHQAIGRRSVGDREPIASQSQSQVPLHPSGPEHLSITSLSVPRQDDRGDGSGPAGCRGTEGPADLFMELSRTAYRSNSRNRDSDLTAAVARLDAAGISKSDLLKLAHRAVRKGNKPNGLFAMWIDDPNEALKELGKR